MHHLQRQVLVTGIWVCFALASVMTISYSPNWCHEEALTDSQRLLPKLATGEPRLLGLIRANEQVVFAKSAVSDEWSAQAPLNMPADLAAIREVIAELRNIRVLRRVQAPVRADLSARLREMGIAAGFAWRVEVGDEEWTVRFGTRAPGGRQGTYVAVTDSMHGLPAIYVVTARTTSLDLEPERLLDTRVLRSNASAIKEFVVESRGIRLHARRDPRNEHWFTAESSHVRISNEQIALLFDRLSNLRVQSHDPPMRVANDVRPTATIKLTLENGNTNIELLSSCSADQRFVWTRIIGSRTQQSCIDVSSLKQVLLGETDEWYDSHLFTLRVDEVESVTTRIGKQRTDVSRDGTDFLITSREPSRLALDVGNEYLAKLLSTRGKIVENRSFRDQWSVPEAGDYIEIRSSTVVHDGDSLVEKLLLGPLFRDGSRLVKRTDDAALLVVDETTADLLCGLGAKAPSPQ
jgi:hypothetical protein